ncbi:hypothetical protein PFISCL1PPCAC_13748, partial [Pristionchus fissidentatus]
SGQTDERQLSEVTNDDEGEGIEDTRVPDAAEPAHVRTRVDRTVSDGRKQREGEEERGTERPHVVRFGALGLKNRRPPPFSLDAEQ